MDLMVPDSGLLFWMLISFGILVFVLAKFGWPVITGMASRRKERIESSLAEAEQARALLATLKEQGDQLMEQARANQAQMQAQTAELRRQLVQEAREAAVAQGEAIIAQSRRQAAEEKEVAMQELRSYVALLSVQVAEKILRTQLDKGNSQADLINRIIDETIQPPTA